MLQDIENEHTRIFRNIKLPAERRHQAAIAIFSCPSFYKPKTLLTVDLLKDITSLNQGSPDNIRLIESYLKTFDKRPKYTYYEQKPEEIPKYLQDCKDFLSIASTVYMHRDYSAEQSIEALFRNELSIFFKFVLLTSLLHDQHSSGWRDLIDVLTKIKGNQSFSEQLGKESTYPLYTLISVIVDSDSRVFSVGQGSYISALAPEAREKELQNLRSLVLKKLSPLSNVIFCDHLLSVGIKYDEVLQSAESGIIFIRNLRSNFFFIGNEWEAKLLIAKCKVLLSKKVEMTTEKRNAQFSQSCQRLKDLCTSSANFQMINAELPLLIYDFKVQSEGLKGAREYLEELEKGGEGFAKSNLKQDWIKSQKAWLTYSYISEISNDKAEQFSMIRGAIVLLKESIELNPQNSESLIRLGTLYFNYFTELGIPPKQVQLQWLQALKMDQSTAEGYYCLGLFYTFVERDLVRAQKCLEKVIILRPDLEDAGVLLYQLLIEQGQISYASEVLDKVQRANPLLAYPYYLQGVRLQNNGDYANARLMFENAARYHGFYSTTEERAKPNFPLLGEVVSAKQAGQTSLYSRELGIFSKNGIAIYLHLAECHLQMEKYPTAEKCFKQIFIELDKYLENPSDVVPQIEVSQDRGILQEIQSIISQCSTDAYVDDETQSTIRKISSYFKISKDKSCTLELDLLEALILGGKVESKLRNYHQSLMYASLSLQALQLSSIDTQLKDQLLWESIQVVIDSLLLLIDENLGGKADRKQIEKKKYVNSLTKIAEIISKHEEVLLSNERISRQLAQAFKVIGEETMEFSFVMRALQIFERLIADTKIEIASYKRGLKLDLARVYHLVDLIFNDQAGQTQSKDKIRIIRELIKENPSKGEYWVYHGIFQTNEEVKLNSYYKALQIDPKDQFALNNILCLHMRKKNYRQAFKVLNHIRDIESLNALVVALMVLLHARIALESPESDLAPQQRRRYLQEAISIGEMFLEIEQEKLDQADVKITEAKLIRDQRVDIHQFLSTQMNYLVTLMQYEEDQSQVSRIDMQEIVQEKLLESGESQGLLQKMLAKVQVQSLLKVESLKDLQAMIERTIQFGPSQGLSSIISLIKELQEGTTGSLQSSANSYQNEFLNNPSDQNALMLIAIQEKCIQNKVVISNQFIEEINAQDFKKLVDSLDQSIAQKLVHLSLQHLFLKYPYQFDRLIEYSDILEENQYSQLSTLSELEYEKIFKLYLINSLDTHESHIRFRREIKKVMSRGVPNINQFLNKLIFEKERKEQNLYLEIMKYPSKLDGHNQCLWKFIKDGQIAKAKRFSDVIATKIQNGIISEFTDQDQFLFRDYCKVIEAINSKNEKFLAVCTSLSAPTVSLLEAFILITKNTQDQAASTDPEVLNILVQSVIPAWLDCYTDSNEIVEEQLNLLYSLLTKLLLNQGYLGVFNELGDKLLAFIDTQDKLNPFFICELKAFLMVNMALNSSVLGKKAQANKMATAVEKFFKEEGEYTRRYNLRLFKAAMKLSVNQYAESEALIKGITESSYERDILSAISYFSLQEYKKYYLICIELVTSLKQEILSSNSRADAEYFQFMLGYSYFLKARAELTFMEARKQGITLKEDFNMQESQLFTTQHFQNKSKKSLAKSISQFEGWPEIQEFVKTFESKL